MHFLYTCCANAVVLFVWSRHPCHDIKHRERASIERTSHLGALYLTRIHGVQYLMGKYCPLPRHYTTRVYWFGHQITLSRNNTSRIIRITPTMPPMP